MNQRYRMTNAPVISKITMQQLKIRLNEVPQKMMVV